jgi:hypothetical protein
MDLELRVLKKIQMVRYTQITERSCILAMDTRENLKYSDTSHTLLNKYPIWIGYGCAPDTVRMHIRYATWCIGLFYSVKATDTISDTSEFDLDTAYSIWIRLGYGSEWNSHCHTGNMIMWSLAQIRKIIPWERDSNLDFIAPHIVWFCRHL